MAQTMYRVVYTTKMGDQSARVYATLPSDAYAAVVAAHPSGTHHSALGLVSVQQMSGNAEILVGS